MFVGTGWDLKLSLTYWGNDLENMRVWFYKETPKGEALPNKQVLQKAQMIPPRGSSTAGVTGDVAFAAQSGAWGGVGTRPCKTWAGGSGETLPLQLGTAHTAPREDPYFKECYSSWCHCYSVVF